MPESIASIAIACALLAATEWLIRRKQLSRRRRLLIDIVTVTVFVTDLIRVALALDERDLLPNIVAGSALMAASSRLLFVLLVSVPARPFVMVEGEEEPDEIVGSPTIVDSLVDDFLTRVPSVLDDPLIRENPPPARDGSEAFAVLIVPFVVELLRTDAADARLGDAFVFFEEMATHEEQPVRDLLIDVVCRGLADAGPETLHRAREWMGPATLDLSTRDEFERELETLWPDDAPHTVTALGPERD